MHEQLTIGTATAYHSYQEGSGKRPGLILIEEIWGVNAHVRSVADRFAAAGFSVLAPEILPEGLLAFLTPQMQKDIFDPKKRDELQPKMRAAMQPIQQPEYAAGAIAILKASVDHLLADEHTSDNVGVLGFCFGGSYSFHLAAHDARIKAAVPFYGQPPPDDEVAALNCPILAFYGDQDAHLMQTLPHLKEEMDKRDKQFEAVVYPDVGHAFFNDTNARMYNAAAADAWEKALTFLKEQLA